MALRAAGTSDVGIATLSLDNLQGGVRKWASGVWPLFDVRPDPDRVFLGQTEDRDQVAVSGIESSTSRVFLSRQMRKQCSLDMQVGTWPVGSQLPPSAKPFDDRTIRELGGQVCVGSDHG